MKSRIAQGLHHVAHRSGQDADLVSAPGHDGHRQITVTDPARVSRQLLQRPRDPPCQHHAAGHGEQQRHQAERERDAGLGVDVLGVVGRGDDNLHHPLQITDRDGHRADEIRLALVLEFVRGVAHRGLSHRRGGELGVDDLSTRGAGAPAPDQQRALRRRDEHAPARRHLQVFEGARQPVQREIHGEDALHAAQQVEDRSGAGDAESAAGVELVRLGPHRRSLSFRSAEVRPLRRTVAMVIGAAHRLPAAVRENAIFLEPDAPSIREALVDVDVVARITPRAEETG
jgi:hypothetical protein